LIKKLNKDDGELMKEMQSVFQSSYAVEAKILKAQDFPPLKRKLEDYINCKNDFFGFFKNEELTGVVEIKYNPGFIHIQSLVVDPVFFRQGVGNELMQFTLGNLDSDAFMVETGVDNGPAISLYKKMGFEEVEQWDTNHGIRKVRFIKSR